MPKSGYMIFNTWFCTAWPAAWPAAWSAACRALFAASLKVSTKGGRLRRPPFVDMLLNAANNALHDAGHAESCRITENCKTYSHLNNLMRNHAESLRFVKLTAT